MILVFLMQPLVAPCIFDPQESMLDHDEEDVLNDPTNSKISYFLSLHNAAEREEHQIHEGGQEPEVRYIIEYVI